MITINYWAVLAAAVASMIIGSIWYSPLLFAKKWLAAMGWSKEHLEAEESLRD